MTYHLGTLDRSLSLLESQFHTCDDGRWFPTKTLVLCFHSNRILLDTCHSARHFPAFLDEVWSPDYVPTSGL